MLRGIHGRQKPERLHVYMGVANSSPTGLSLLEVSGALHIASGRLAF